MSVIEEGQAALASVDTQAWPQDLIDCYAQHAGPLTGYLLSLVGDLSLAQDLAQEAFIRVFARWRTVDHPKAYVYLTGINLAKQHWRRGGRESAAFATVAMTTEAAADPHEPWLRDIVERLPKRLRVPVLLHYYADLPLTEVSSLLQIPLGTAKRRLHEARELLREILEDAHA